MWVLVALLCVSVFLILCLALMLKTRAHLNKFLNEQLAKKMMEVANSNAKCEEKDALIAQMKADFSEEKQSLKNEYQANLAQLEAKYKLNLEELKKELALNWQEQNSKFLLQNKLMFNDEGKKALGEIFTPIKKSIEEYEKGVKEYSKQLISNEATLQTHIKLMFESSKQIGEKADEFAQILKGEKKIRGNFAELQLKNVLEQSGLMPNEQYKLQEQFNDEGKRYVPDAVVYLDKEKSIIIDAKFSLPNNLDESDKISKDLCQNLKGRIDELAKKAYDKNIPNSYEYVLLFIPYQNILDLALEFEPNLFQYAYEKKICLATPHTLFMLLKTINISWRHIQSNENINEVFKQFDKFYKTIENICSIFGTIKRQVNDMDTKLNGRQGLIPQSKKLKEQLENTANKVTNNQTSEENLFLQGKDDESSG